jgi:DNA-binding transcriptional LysR family regulator
MAARFRQWRGIDVSDSRWSRRPFVQLEEWLGISLLMRSTRSVVPTEAGRIFYEHAKRTIEEAGEAVVAAPGSARGLSGKLRVSLWFSLDGSMSLVGVFSRTP